MENSDESRNPEGGEELWRGAMQPALGTDLMERILSPENLHRAWKQVRSNKGAPGIDGMSLEDFPNYARDHWEEIRQTVRNGSYHPSAVRRVVIPKPGGRGERLLGVPTIIDRVLQQAIAQVLTPIFEPEFSEFSFGSRPNRSAHGAIKQVKEYVKQGYRVAVDVDLEKFFDTVNHDILMARVARKVRDKTLLSLIGRYLRAGVMVGGEIQTTEWGTPQGSPISPLLANILLNDLDQELESRGHRFVRYVDDVVIMVKSSRAGKRVMTSITRYLTKELRLKVNLDKSRVCRVERLEYLGFTFQGIRIVWTERAYQDLKHRLRGLTSRRWRVSMEYRIERVNMYLRGWMGYYGISKLYGPIPELDSWLRRRIRMCYWKQWRRPRTRIGNLLKLGTPRSHAFSTGLSRKGYWRLSRTLATHTGMTNEWLAQQGLLSIRDLWMKVQGYEKKPKGVSSR
jgi:RNA-directed DNA polymerase